MTVVLFIPFSVCVDCYKDWW